MTLILVVDDEVAICDGVCDILDLHGYEARGANNGQQALELLGEIVPDLIISDIMMPVMDGYAFYEAVRQNDNWLAIPFIFLTARDQRADIRRGKQLGADDYLTKPFEMQDLIIAVEAKLRRAAEIQKPVRAKIDQLSDQLVHSERLATIGQLTAEFAHEIKNPLTAIAMYAEFAQRDLAGIDPQLAQDMGHIMAQSDRISRLAKSLLTFSRQAPQILQGVSLSKLFDRVLDVIRFRLGEVVVEQAHAPDLPLIQADASQLEQVLINLAVNAIQAMPKGGKLTLRTGSRLSDQPGSPPSVFAAVSDTGCGIAPENLGRLFEPYFTTKKAGEGTGLGLYVCKNIVDQHQGTIEVESQVGFGTTFTVLLPISQAEAGQ